MPVPSSKTLTTRALNRALLDRQMLLRRSPASAHDTIAHLVGMQAQAPYAPYTGLWTRMTRFRQDELSGLLTDRRVVRIALMRSTVHLVTAEDCLWLRPLVQPALDRDLYPNNLYGRHRLDGLDLDAVVEAGSALMAQRPLSTGELREQLGARWPDREPAALAYVLRNLAALVQVPPRGIWGVGGQTTCTTVQTWLGRDLHPDPSPADLVLRYLAAFGPATVKDVQTWAGITRLRPVVKEIEDRLVVLRAEGGEELYDLPDAPRPDAGAPAPVRFLPEYDNLLLSHADRSRVIAQEHRKLVYTGNGMKPTFLVDGFVAGTWKIDQKRSAATLALTPFARLTAQQKAELAEEGERLLSFTAPDSQSRDIRFEQAG
ncbi:hypothetical protein AMK26_33340 [Streptomyces sp. CB03234]|uniref:winged helix DNA-binding domain-containing protein n=1 Tax=Streptomyces sp. (strain CB03234) TaxID=1703937 RepID=UPI00093940E1|nr:winged helix DNA-binding domain-containing protein [Streptomyces sp. CB03234]OKJ94677.1 hypothetical protein AMK26_33340 [Streptomyces sp. CB03234]